MSRKRRITKHITIEQMDFLKYLETEEIQIFSIEDTKNFDFQGEITNELLENLTKKNSSLALSGENIVVPISETKM